MKVPASIANEIQEFRYRERFHLSYNEMMKEPASEIRKAELIWSLDSERAKLNTERLDN